MPLTQEQQAMIAATLARIRSALKGEGPAPEPAHLFQPEVYRDPKG